MAAGIGVSVIAALLFFGLIPKLQKSDPSELVVIAPASARPGSNNSNGARGIPSAASKIPAVEAKAIARLFSPPAPIARFAKG
jgi:hypothetical protein